MMLSLKISKKLIKNYKERIDEYLCIYKYNNNSNNISNNNNI